MSYPPMESPSNLSKKLTSENSNAALSTNSFSDQTKVRGPTSRLSSAPTAIAIRYDGIGTGWRNLSTSRKIYRYNNYKPLSLFHLLIWHNIKRHWCDMGIFVHWMLSALYCCCSCFPLPSGDGLTEACHMVRDILLLYCYNEYSASLISPCGLGDQQSFFPLTQHWSRECLWIASTVLDETG